VLSYWRAARNAWRDFRSTYCLLLTATLIVYPGTQLTSLIMFGIPIVVEIRNQLGAPEPADGAVRRRGDGRRRAQRHVLRQRGAVARVPAPQFHRRGFGEWRARLDSNQ
jgi:hypothetical protein